MKIMKFLTFYCTLLSEELFQEKLKKIFTRSFQEIIMVMNNVKVTFVQLNCVGITFLN